MRNILIFILLLLSSCRTITEYIPVVSTQYIVQERVDSIYDRDSVFVYLNNDTVYIYKEKQKKQYVYRTDTVHTTDTITIVKRLEIVQEKKINNLYWWQKALMFLGIVALLSIIKYLYKWKL